MIKAQDLHKQFGQLQVLKGVDIEVAKAEIVSIMGASGAGKTTLLQILGTLERADKGKLFFGDEDLSSYSTAKLSQFRNQHLGFIFQFHHLLPEFTAQENVAIPGLISRKAKKECLIRAAELLDFMGLKDRADHKPSSLSGGEQQRVAVARALMNKPSLVLADEPTGNLDSANANEIHRLFNAIRLEFGTSFVIITHNQELAKTADRIIQMVDGKLLK
jgi:lipoprotein-releasing system ATP-binding protein